jgi:DNA-binding NtrC family response regulator
MTKKTNLSPLPKPANDAPTILHLDDVRSYRLGLRRALARECGIRVIEAEDVLHAIRALERHPEILVVVADLKLPHGGLGLNLLRTSKQRWPAKPRLLLSAYSEDVVDVCVSEGHAVLDKSHPWSVITSTICEMAKAA